MRRKIGHPPTIPCIPCQPGPASRFLYNEVGRVNAQAVPGDIVLCGVYRGGLAMALALAQKRFGTHRRIWLFDTFEGKPSLRNPPQCNT